jgi:Mobilization protein NikA
MAVLTVRLSEAEKAKLNREAAAEGVTTGAYVRQLLRETPLRTGRELLREMESRLGDASLRIKARK